MITSFGATLYLKCPTNLSLRLSGLVEETKLTFSDLFGDSKEWQTRVIKTDVQDIIARRVPATSCCLAPSTESHWQDSPHEYFLALSSVETKNGWTLRRITRLAALRPSVSYVHTKPWSGRSCSGSHPTALEPALTTAKPEFLSSRSSKRGERR